MCTKMIYIKIIKCRFVLTIVFGMLVTSMLFIVIVNDGPFPNSFFINVSSTPTVGDVSCHYIETSGVVETVDKHFAPAADSIFFHETSCRGGLNPRQVCSIESAARVHPHRDIYVLFSAPVTKINGNLPIDLLKKYSNVKFKRVLILEYAKGTPVEDLVASGALSRSLWPVSHTSDVLRFLTLYKWGGLYLDLDIIVTKPMDDLSKNWAARESETFVASCVLAFDRDDLGRMIADTVLRELSKSFSGEYWAQNGPRLITSVLQTVCATQNITSMSAEKCQGFEVYDPKLFFPISWQNANQFLKPGNVSQEPYMYHVWNHLTEGNKIMNNSLYIELTRQFCPRVYEAYGDHFED